jgi:hypothetical protein
MTVAEVLSRAGVGVSEREFAALVASVLDELGPPPADAPRDALTAEQARALDAIGADLAPRRRRERDPRVDAAATYAAVLADALGVGDVATRLRIDPSRVRHRLAKRQLVGIRRADGWRLPRWQFGADGEPLPGLERVLRALPADAHPVVVARFFATPVPELRVGRSAVSPRGWLEGGGDPTTVAALAAALGHTL